ncbi:MAG: hypothetical protein PSV13_10720 [Lacunisphaera sp.]|nr:hypothetical protein [Lacunisphaera sp.]
MNWNDYEAAWKRQELPVGANADLASLRETFETKRRKLAAAIQVRDIAEAGAGLIVAGAYAFFWWQIGRTGWPLGFAIALILGVAGFFVRERFRARRLRLGRAAPLLAKVEADMAELRHQCRLVRTVWAWYLAPCAGAIAIQVWVIVRRAPAWSPVHEPWVLFGFGVFFALMLWFAWVLNRRALRQRLEPRLAELEKLHRDLLSPRD